MTYIPKTYYSMLDRPEVLMLLFHPRPELTGFADKSSGLDILIPVENDVQIGARFHLKNKAAANIIFFHGNGEIVADYDDLGHLYNDRLSINFLPVDYRGYGRSTGVPTVTAMMRDCYTIFDYITKWLDENSYTGPLIVMGRSLGSASALELSANFKDRIDALIIESGFAYTAPLLRLLGIDIETLGFKQEDNIQNIKNIRSFDKPTLVIHAQFDNIIPFSDGQALYDACGAADKTMLQIPMADHNDIFMRGLHEYLAAVKTLAENLTRGNSNR